MTAGLLGGSSERNLALAVEGGFQLLARPRGRQRGAFSSSETSTSASAFSVGISTSDSPYIAGQPSDVIIGGGANLRFIKSIEVYARSGQ